MANYFGMPDAGSEEFDANAWNQAVADWKAANPGKIPLGHEFGLTEGDYSGLGYAPGVTDLNSFIGNAQGAYTTGVDPATGIPYAQTASGTVNPFPEYQKDDFLDKYGAAIIGGIGGIGALAGGLGGVGAGFGGVGTDAALATGLEAAGGAGGALIDPSWGANLRGGDMDLYELADELFSQGGDAVNAGGLDGALGDSLGNYTQGMGAENAFTTAGGAGSNELLNWLSKQGSSNLLSQLLGSGTQGLSSYFASKAQQDAAAQANDTLWKMFQQNRSDLEPWRTAGVGALGQLTNLTTPGKQFDQMALDPGYQFRLGEGQKALDNRQRAAGKFYSGAGLKAASDYNQNFASNEFNNVYNRLAGLSGTGQTATNTVAGLGANTANAAAGNEIGGGNARASGYMGIGGAVNQGINSYNANQNYNQMLDLLRGSSLFR